MPLTETQPDAVANVYAQSLFELAMAKGGQPTAEATLGELEEIVELARADAKLGEFFASRILARGERARVIKSIFAGRASEHVVNFLLVLNNKGRLSKLTGIVAAFDKLAQTAFGRVEVDVYTASPMDADELARLKQSLQGKLGREPVLHPYTDPKMLGGIKFQIGDQLVDAAVSTRLRKLRDQMNGQGLAQVKSAADRIIRADPSSNGH